MFKLLQTVYIFVLFLIPWAAPFSVDPSIFGRKANIPQKCSHFRDHNMMAVDCYGLDFRAVPQNLRTDVELLQLTNNKLGRLKRDSFKRYKFLKYLYLDDNVIFYIENGTFDPLQDLEVIRLSHNEIDRVPSDILQLPYIRKIFLDNNPLIPGGGFIGAPASETLESLTLAYCHLEELPPLEGYPSLLELNVSGNDLKRISPKQLAPMCQLHWLDLRGNPKLSHGSTGDGCDCHLLASWIADRNIILQSGYTLNCALNRHDFTRCGNMTEAMEIHEACMSTVAFRAELRQARTTWILVLSILAATIVVVILILIFIRRRNKRKNRKKKKKARMNNNTDGRGSSELEEQEIQSGELPKEVQS